VPAQPRPLIELDLTESSSVSRWQPTHDVSRIEATPSGMLIRISGSDPYIMGPAIGAPAGKTLWLRMRLRSEAGGTAQVFHFEDYPTEARSASAAVPAKRWTEISMPLPPLTPRTRLRFDPPGVTGTCTVAYIRLFERRILPAPNWTPPPPIASAKRVSVRSGELTLSHAPDRDGAFVVTVAGYPMASGWSRLPVAYMANDEPSWTDLALRGRTSVAAKGPAIETTLTAVDPDGGKWNVIRRFTPGKLPGVIEVTTTVTVSRLRRVYFLPVLALFPGVSSFGAAREHAIFAGLEYLDPPDRSSSEDDLRGEQAKRLVPDLAKITFPLMAMQAKKRYVGLTWDMRPWFAAAFDTPDRSFGSRANAMALLFPGSDGTNRSEGSLLPYDGRDLEAGYKLTLTARIIGGTGAGVIPALQKYVALRGLPPVPPTGMDRTRYARWAAGGWLDSRISEGARFRHAYWPGITSFAPHAAADAATWMEWCAATCGDAALARRLRSKAREALDVTSPADRNGLTVSHVTYPVQTLLFGDALGGARRAADAVRESLARFEKDGTILYRPGSVDYGTTHFEKHANGLTSQIVAGMLTNAIVAGNRDLIRAAVAKLRALDRYANTAPRGAQTWEVPLHTPDILASAYLVKAYTLGYEVTGDRHFLAMAAHWAWTGIPFVYLVKPVPHPIGLYATIPVFGATNWVAPNWMGLPVQWCGLVYSDALYRLARYDGSTNWKRIADGIAASGVQQSWPASDKDLQGLLPDSVTLKAQHRNAVAINPGTVQANAVRLFGGPEVYDYRVFRKSGCIVHAPASLVAASEAKGLVRLTLRPWIARETRMLVSGLVRRPTVIVNGRTIDLSASGVYDAAAGRAAIPIPPASAGSVAVTIKL
jgi:hypothetical protein